MTAQNTYETKNPFMNNLFSMDGKKLVKLSDGSYYDVVRNWVYIETQDLNENGATYDITMYRPWDLDLEHPVNDIKR